MSIQALLPLIIIELILLIVALVDIIRRDRSEIVSHRKWPWVVISLVIGGIGPILYLAAGRRRS
jgi:hypothetical protein